MTNPEIPRTVAERLDAAETRDEFLNVLEDLFSALETAKDKQP